MCEHKHSKKAILRAYFAIRSIRQTEKMSIKKKNEHYGSRSMNIPSDLFVESSIFKLTNLKNHVITAQDAVLKELQIFQQESLL